MYWESLGEFKVKSGKNRFATFYTKDVLSFQVKTSVALHVCDGRQK